MDGTETWAVPLAGEIAAIARALLADTPQASYKNTVNPSGETHVRTITPEDGAAIAKQLRASADAAWELGNKDLSETLHAQARELEDGAA